MQLTLSDMEIGRFTPPRKWVYGKQDDLDWRQTFIGRLDAPLLHISIPTDADAYHRNYMEYLEKCWRDHVGIVVTPDIIWHMLMCEVATVVKSDPEFYRHLFSEQEEKQTLTVIDEGFVMPLNKLVALLKAHVPADSALFLPHFSTTDERSQHALISAFCDVCSPHYNYTMFLCGFPAIDVRGTEDDWSLMYTAWGELCNALKQPSEWLDKITVTLQTCCDRLNDREWWIDMFCIERCGSGGEMEAHGWLTEMFLTQPKLRFPQNFASCVSIVDYRHLNSQKDFRMQDGLFFSQYDGDFAVPGFAYTVHERT